MCLIVCIIGEMKNNIRINVIVNVIRTLVLTLLSFITFPWVCRYLGDSAVGAYTWANTFVAYFLILAKIGIPNLAVRECVKVRDDKEKLSNKVQAFFMLQLIGRISLSPPHFLSSRSSNNIGYFDRAACHSLTVQLHPLYHSVQTM